MEDKKENIKSTEELIAKLKELGDLRTNGIITEDEFVKMKARLIG